VKEGPQKGMLLLRSAGERQILLTVWTYLYHTTLQYTNNAGLTQPWVRSFSEYALDGDRTTPTELRSLFIGATQEKMEASFTTL
jgi:hypothetical protein